MRAFPPALRQAIEARLVGKSRRDLSIRSEAISTAYRAGRNSALPLRTADDALAYAVARMPATFAAMAYALEALAAATPGLAPATLTDAGCGPGAAAFAATALFPSLGTVTLADRNGPFLDLADSLCRDVLADRSWRISNIDLGQNPVLPPSDLVTAGYVLAELAPTAQDALVRRLWAAAGMALVITEPGTPDGFARLRAARSALLAAGAHVAAPCTHHAPCPMTAPGWCRFPVRLARSRDHLMLKGGSLPYEDEPMAYLAVTREPPTRRASYRVVGPADASKIAVHLPACGAAGLETLDASARDREKYREYKRLDWGDEV